jgi:hypothetical protein
LKSSGIRFALVFSLSHPAKDQKGHGATWRMQPVPGNCYFFLSAFPMSTSYLPSHEFPVSSRDLTPKHRKNLKPAMKEFLLEESRRPAREGICQRCERQLEYIETTLWFYDDDDDSFCIRLLVCGCAEKALD